MDAVKIGASNSVQDDSVPVEVKVADEIPPPPPPDFETLWPLLIHIVGSILVGTAAISSSA